MSDYKFHRANSIDTYAWSFYHIIYDFSTGKINQIVSGQFLPNNYFLTGKKFRILVLGQFLIKFLFFHRTRVTNTAVRSICRIISNFHQATVTNTSVRSLCRVTSVRIVVTNSRTIYYCL